jgi:hypothetical protein
MSSDKEDNEATQNLFSALVSLDPSGVGSFVLDAANGLLGIRDRLYLSKLKKFWSALDDNKIEIEDYINRIKADENWQKAGRDLLLIIDSFSYLDKCYYYGKVWVAKLQNTINEKEFAEMTSILQAIFITDLQNMLGGKEKEANRDRLYNCGMLRRMSMIGSGAVRAGNVGNMLSYDMSDTEQDFAKTKNHLAKTIENVNDPYDLTGVGKKFLSILK